jgi:hypothetical protein
MALADIIYNFQNDPDRNKKIFFFVGWAVVLILIGSGIWLLNSPSSPSQPPLDTNIAEQTLDDSILKSTPSKFPESLSLKSINTKSVKNDRSFIIDSLGNPVFVDTSGNFMLGENVISPNFPIQTPLSIYPMKLGYIVNDYLNSLFLIRDESGFKVRPNPENIGQVVSLNTGLDEFGFTSQEEFYFINRNETGYTLKKSKSIQLDSTQDIGFITSDLATSGIYQIFRSGNTLVIALFENPSQQGRAEYWIFKNGKMLKTVEIFDNWSTLVQGNYLIITQQSLFSDIISSYRNEIYDLTTETPTAIDFSSTFNIRRLGLYGNMLARRCTVTSNNDIYCLVKERPVKTDDVNEPDIVVKINLSNKTAEILSSNTSIPAGSAILSDLARRRLLVTGSKDLLVYELPLS